MNTNQNKHQEVFERLSKALSKLTRNASEYFGMDCMAHAALAHGILTEQGIPTRIVVGEAAWRVGPGDSDVIAHSPRLTGFAPAGVKAAAYHAWLESEDLIIDFSTHSLAQKAADLDATDGGTTQVAWCPPYLCLSKDQTLSLREVTQAPREGVACYCELPGFKEALQVRGMKIERDEEDLLPLRIIFNNPDIEVIGPTTGKFLAAGQMQPA